MRQDSRRPEICSRQCEIGHGRSKAGSRYPENGGSGPEHGSRRCESASRRSETGRRRSEHDGRSRKQASLKSDSRRRLCRLMCGSALRFRSGSNEVRGFASTHWA